MSIPRLIHQTWRTEDVPAEWRALAESWRRHHPHWEHRLWTDQDNQRLVDEHCPEISAQYASCDHGVQRSDIARYLIVHRHGGVYVDLDMECLRPLDPLLAGRECVLTLEPWMHAGWTGRRELVSNAFLAAAPGHSFFTAAIERLRARELRAGSPGDVLASTGPVFLSELLGDIGAAAVALLPPEAFSPFNSTSEALARLRDGAVDADTVRAECLRRGAWAIHYWSNSWARGLAGPLVNPDPHGVEGYVFYPGLDSIGHDLANGGRDVAHLAARCDADSLAAGFNTDGFLKAVLRPRHEWTRMPYVGADQGLYVKRAFHFGDARSTGPSSRSALADGSTLGGTGLATRKP